MLRITLGTMLAAAAAAGMMALAQPADPVLRAGPRPDAEPEAHPPLVQWAGPDTKRAEAGYVIARDEAAWQRLWAEHSGATVKEFEVIARHAAPKIDFGRCVVLAFFRGDTTNEDGEPAGAIQEFAGHVRLRFEPATFQTLSTTGEDRGVATRPYGIWVIGQADRDRGGPPPLAQRAGEVARGEAV